MCDEIGIALNKNADPVRPEPAVDAVRHPRRHAGARPRSGWTRRRCARSRASSARPLQNPEDEGGEGQGPRRASAELMQASRLSLRSGLGPGMQHWPVHGRRQGCRPGPVAGEAHSGTARLGSTVTPTWSSSLASAVDVLRRRRRWSGASPCGSGAIDQPSDRKVHARADAHDGRAGDVRRDSSSALGVSRAPALLRRRIEPLQRRAARARWSPCTRSGPRRRSTTSRTSPPCRSSPARSLIAGLLVLGGVSCSTSSSRARASCALGADLAVPADDPVGGRRW